MNVGIGNDSIGINDATIEIKIVHKKVIIIVVGFVLLTKTVRSLFGPMPGKSHATLLLPADAKLFQKVYFSLFVYQLRGK